MKRYGNLFDRIADKDNLRLAFRQAKKKGRKTPAGMRAVKRIEADLDRYIDELQL